MSWIGYVLKHGNTSPLLRTIPYVQRFSRGKVIAIARARADTYLSKASRLYVMAMPQARPDERETLFHTYVRLKALHVLWDSFASDVHVSREALSDRLVVRLSDELSAERENRYQAASVIRALALSAELRLCAPGLFEGALTEAIDVRTRQREKESARLTELRLRDQTLLSQIAKDRGEIAVLFDMVKARQDIGAHQGISDLVWQIETLQERLMRAKRKLLVPIDPTWQDDVRLDALDDH